VPRPSLFDLITRIIFGDEYRSLSSSLCSLLHSPVAPSLLGPNIPLSTLFSNTLSRSQPTRTKMLTLNGTSTVNYCILIKCLLTSVVYSKWLCQTHRAHAEHNKIRKPKPVLYTSRRLTNSSIKTLNCSTWRGKFYVLRSTYVEFYIVLTL
jgi:hypothetical protein